MIGNRNHLHSSGKKNIRWCRVNFKMDSLFGMFAFGEGFLKDRLQL